MKKFLFLFLISLFLFTNSGKGQKADHLVIAEIYGAGGNSGAIYKNDYIVIYNPMDSVVDLSSWSIQYQSASSNTSPWSNYKTNLVGVINAGSYYLIQEAGGPNGSILPINPNISDNISLNATDGKVALVNDQNLITDREDSNVVDFVGYGSANAFEGSGPAPSPTTNISICRRDNEGGISYGIIGNGYDTNNNNNDFFQNATPSPLPVELSSFSAKAFSSSVQLNWQTATEVNNYGFEIERSPSQPSRRGGDFRPTLWGGWGAIGFVNGSGSSNSVKEYSFVDKNISSGKYCYRLKQIDNDGRFKYSKEIEAEVNTPLRFALNQNYPNPFNPVTVIEYQLPVDNYVTLKVYDIIGDEIITLVNGNLKAGIHTVSFDANNLSNGVYFYKLTCGTNTQMKKMILLK